MRRYVLTVLILTCALAAMMGDPHVSGQPQTDHPSQDKRSENRGRWSDPSTNLLWILGEEKSHLGPYAKMVLKELADGHVSTVREAEKVALFYKLGHGSLVNLESPDVVDLVRLARDVPDFAEKDDLVWVVRFSFGALDSLTQELWINSADGKVRAVFPPWPDKNPATSTFTPSIDKGQRAK